MSDPKPNVTFSTNTEEDKSNDSTAAPAPSPAVNQPRASTEANSQPGVSVVSMDQILGNLLGSILPPGHARRPPRDEACPVHGRRHDESDDESEDDEREEDEDPRLEAFRDLVKAHNRLVQSHNDLIRAFVQLASRDDSDSDEEDLD